MARILLTQAQLTSSTPRLLAMISMRLSPLRLARLIIPAWCLRVGTKTRHSRRSLTSRTPRCPTLIWRCTPSLCRFSSTFRSIQSAAAMTLALMISGSITARRSASSPNPRRMATPLAVGSSTVSRFLLRPSLPTTPCLLPPGFPAVLSR